MTSTAQSTDGSAAGQFGPTGEEALADCLDDAAYLRRLTGSELDPELGWE